MGHFSFSCGLTGLPITSGSKVVLLPLKKRKLFSDLSEATLLKKGVASFISNDGERVFYIEGTYPIFGQYNDYGGIENIEKDEHTALIEKYHGMSIEEFCELVCDGRRDGYETDRFSKFHGKENTIKHFHEILGLSATWFRREVYEDLKIEADTEWREELELGHEEILTKLGFEFKRKIQGKDERFNLVYGKGEIELTSDGTWIQVPQANVYRLKDLKEYCESRGEPLDITSVNFSSYTEQLYELILPKMVISEIIETKTKEEINALGEEERMNYLKDLLEDLRLKLSPSMTSRKCNMLFCPSGYMEEPKEFFNFCKEYVITHPGKLKWNIINWLDFRPNLFFLGRFLSPISTSPQDGEHAGVKRIYEAALKAINTDIEKRGEY